jgi:hypothetical protein
MTQFLRPHYDTEGPFGLPMKDRQARALNALLKTLPPGDAYQPGKLVVDKATTELLPGERADVSWISTEDPDRQRDIVVAKGMSDEHFKLNPIVTMQHAYWLPPVGKSLWRKVVKDGDRRGVKAKTQYPQRPDSWSEGDDWPSDCAFTLVQAGLLNGKSIGFLPTKVRYPTDEEQQADPALRKVWRIVEEWLLLEYACVYLPAQQNAVVEAVSKGVYIPPEFLKALGLELPARPRPADVIPFTAVSEIEKALNAAVANFNPRPVVEAAVQDALDRRRGRI